MTMDDTALTSWRTLLEQGWAMVVVNPLAGVARVETPHMVYISSQPAAAFYRGDQTVFAPGATLEDAIRRALSLIPAQEHRT